FLGFARSVDHAADDGHVHGYQYVLQARLQLVHGLDHVEVLPGATGTGDEVDAARAQTQGLENVEADADLLHRVRRQGDADGVTDALGQQHAQAHRGFDGTGPQAAGFSDAQVQGLLDLDRKSTRLNSSHVKISYAVF